MIIFEHLKFQKMKYLLVITILFSLSSCLKNKSNNDIYLKCLINNNKWETSDPILLFNEHVMEFIITNDTLKSLNVVGKRYNKKAYNFVDHERVSINVTINESLQNLSFPITFNNVDIEGYYRNGFRTEENIQSYSPPTRFHVTDFHSTQASFTLESLTRFESCSNKSKVIDNNGNCFEFIGRFSFTGSNHFNEVMEVTNGQFRMKSNPIYY